jgi:hypothetical protein
MFPHQELTLLAARKSVLRREIAVRRVHCAVVVARLAQPLEWLDRALAFWRRLSPLAKFAALPAGLAVQRFLPRGKLLRALVRWGPFALGAARWLRRRAPSGD